MNIVKARHPLPLPPPLNCPFARPGQVKSSRVLLPSYYSSPLPCNYGEIMLVARHEGLTLQVFYLIAFVDAVVDRRSKVWRWIIIMIWTFNHRGIINLDFLGGKIFFYYAYDYWLKVRRKHLVPALITNLVNFLGWKDTDIFSLYIRIEDRK